LINDRNHRAPHRSGDVDNLVRRARQIETTPDIWANWISTIYPDPNNWVGETYISATIPCCPLGLSLASDLTIMCLLSMQN
jgi:hypothetical protein